MRITFRALTLFCTVIFFFSATAQEKFKASPLSKQSASSLQTHFSDYHLFRINTEQLNSFVSRGENKINFELEIPSLTSFRLSLEAHDILSPDYTLTVNSAEGRKTYPKPANMTYRGLLTDVADSKVSLTITDGFIYGRIKKGEKEYYIEPLYYFDKNAANDVFVLYEVTDVKINPSLTCGMTDMQQYKPDASGLNRGQAGTNCVQAQIAIASDASMFIKYGSSATNVQLHNIGVMNNVTGDFVNSQFNDNIEFVIVTQNVSTIEAADQLLPAYNGNVASTVLSRFTDWAYAGNFGTTYDLGQFWTDRSFGTVIGLANVASVCGTFKYHILRDYAGVIPFGSGYQLRALASHEIGHNFGCSHDAASGFIMTPSASATNTSTWSPASINAVNAFVPTATCLSACNLAGPPVANFTYSPAVICPGGSFQFTDRSLNGPDRWYWSFLDGNPDSSFVRNPAVSYSTPGSKIINLTVTNSKGSSSKRASLLVVNPPAIACSIPGPGSEGGIKSFSLGTITNNTGSAAYDGNKYMDFACTKNTSLLPGTTYTVTAIVGDASLGILHKVSFFIDYNNNGNFSDPGEVIFAKFSNCFLGTMSFTFTTPAAPHYDTMFRARLVANACNSQADACSNTTIGQVEDYGVIFLQNFFFHGSRANQMNYMTWELNNELSFDHFELERGYDGMQFSVISNITARKNTDTLEKYNFTDAEKAPATASKTYYRLKMVDVNGTLSYSKVVAIPLDTPETLQTSVYPNPFNDKLYINLQMKSAGVVNISLTDIAGKVVYQYRQMLGTVSRTLSYSGFEHLSRGTYIITIETNGERVSRKIEKL